MKNKKKILIFYPICRPTRGWFWLTLWWGQHGIIRAETDRQVIERVAEIAESASLATHYLDQPDGAYTGQALKGVPQGQGVKIYKNGDRYSGNFENGIFSLNRAASGAGSKRGGQRVDGTARPVGWGREEWGIGNQTSWSAAI